MSPLLLPYVAVGLWMMLRGNELSPLLVAVPLKSPLKLLLERMDVVAVEVEVAVDVAVVVAVAVELLLLMDVAVLLGARNNVGSLLRGSKLLSLPLKLLLKSPLLCRCC